MLSLILLADIQEKDNIKYSVIDFQTTSTEVIFQNVLNELKEKGKTATRMIIFCRKIANVRLLYSMFNRVIGESYIGYKDRPFAMYHA